MENLINRYRNFTTLILVLFAQLILLAYQVKGNKDVPLLRVWTVTAVTPIATRGGRRAVRRCWGFSRTTSCCATCAPRTSRCARRWAV